MKNFWLFVVIGGFGLTNSLKEKQFDVRQVNLKALQKGPTPRIYGGSEAAEGQFKFMVLTLMRLTGDNIFRCSASLIGREWVLLAAHCLSFTELIPKNVILAAGKADLFSYVFHRLQVDFEFPVATEKFGVQEKKAKKFYIHPDFDTNQLIHDVALIRVDGSFDGNSVQTIPLSLDKINQKKSCTILGWGLTNEVDENFKLNFAENKMVSTTRLGCRHKFFGPFICLEPDGRGICSGDSGSPLVCDGKVWGVASHYLDDRNEATCGHSLEEYYADLEADKEWLKSVYAGSGSVWRGSLFCFLFSLTMTGYVHF